VEFTPEPKEEEEKLKQKTDVGLKHLDNHVEQTLIQRMVQKFEIDHDKPIHE